jgi:ubiquitin C-terminal hydrolase
MLKRFKSKAGVSKSTTKENTIIDVNSNYSTLIAKSLDTGINSLGVSPQNSIPQSELSSKNCSSSQLPNNITLTTKSDVPLTRSTSKMGSSENTKSCSVTNENTKDPNNNQNFASDKTILHILPQTFTEEEAQSLEFNVTNPSNLNCPYGDGSDKLFGIENYGYICYVSSIFQCLYHTPQFRKAILEFPTRDNSKPRRRKYTIPGKNQDKILHSISALPNNNNNNNNSTNNNNTNNGIINGTNTNGNTPNTTNATVNGNIIIRNGSTSSISSSTNNSTTGNNANKKLGLFSRSNTENSTNNDSSNNDNNNDTTPLYYQSDFNISIIHHNKEIEKKLIGKYPSIKDLEVNYFLNSQKNITLVGIINDPSATLEWRKKASLIRGPIINLDQSFINDYGMKEENMFTVLKDAFECITENASKTGVLSPYNLIDIIKRDNIMFRNAQHQDAHEFLNFLINNVLESMKRYNKEDLITDIFEGELTSETKCLTCDNSSYRNEKFLDLSIDLESDSSITNCLKMFSKNEMLNENNKFYCENCYSYQEAARTIKIRKIPKILAFHLKRFKYSEKLGRLVKLFYRVEYVKTLRICNTTKDSIQPDKLYELYGVIVHIGGGPYHGHYVSLVKTELYGWLLFDDETIEKIDEEFVFKFFGDGAGLSTAYLLFYREIEDERSFILNKLATGLENDDQSIESFNNVNSGKIDYNNYNNESYNEEVEFSFDTSNMISEDLLPTPPPTYVSGGVSIPDSLDSPFTPTKVNNPIKYTKQNNHSVEEFDPFHKQTSTTLPKLPAESTTTATIINRHRSIAAEPNNTNGQTSRRGSLFGFRKKNQ